MTFRVVILYWLLCIRGTSTSGACGGLSAKFTAIGGQCFWCIGGANMGVGEKSCEQDSGTVFSAESLNDTMAIKEQLNISTSTEVFLGAMFNDVNGTQDYDWLSAPGNYSELLSNLSTLGIGNTSVACLYVTEEIRAVNCDEQMSETICMRDITPLCPCSVGKQANFSSPPTTTPAVGITILASDTSTTTFNNHSKQSASRPSLVTPDVTSTSSIQTKAVTAKTDVLTGKHTNMDDSNTDMDGAITLVPYTGKTSMNTNNTSTSVVDTRTQKTSKPLHDIPQNSSIAVSSTSSQISTGQKKDTMTTQNRAKTTVRPLAITKTYHPDTSQLNKNHPFGMSSTNGTDAITKVIHQSTTTAVTTYCNEQENNTAEEGTNLNNLALDNFSSVLDHVLSHKVHASTKMPCVKSDLENQIKEMKFKVSPDISSGDDNNTDFKNEVKQIKFQVSSNISNTGNLNTDIKNQVKDNKFQVAPNNSNSGNKNTDFKNQVKEVKFQVSPDISNIPPWRGDPDLIPYGENQAIMDILRNTSSELKSLQETDAVTNITFETFAGTIKNVVSHSQIQNIPEKLKVTLLDDIMATAERLVTKIKLPWERLYIKSDIIEVESRLIEIDGGYNESYVPVKDTKKNSVNLSKTIFDANSATRISTIQYKRLGAMMTSSDARVGSHVMSVSVQRIVGNITKTVGISESKGAIILVLETFVLSISTESQQVLLTLTTVGCSLSIACLAMTLIAFAYLRMLSNEKILIHFNLSLALAMAQIVFVSSSDAHSNPVACKVVAILLHFFFMASFTWMLVEGVALYLLCTKGFMNHRNMRLKYLMLGWGVPVVIVLVSLAAKFPNYGHGPQYSCWLSVQDGFIWAFLGPMLAIVVLNMFVMGLVVRKFLTLKAVSQKTEVAKLRGSLRAMMTLLPLLGLTWLLSLLVSFSVVFHYFFVIINTLQGMCIFFLHCICNDELRRKFQAKRRRWSSPTGSDSDTRYTAKRKTVV